jgi:peptide/nickel transport system ATP-binding protein
MAVILITHDLGVVAENADEIAVMYAGRIVEQASARRLFEAPQHPYTWGLLRSIPSLTAPAGEELHPIPGLPPSLINVPSGCSFHPRCAYAKPRHAEVEPALVPAEGGDHRVACLLSPEERAGFWRELSSEKGPS